MSVYTEKKQKTRQRIQEAFIQKLMEKPFDSITVGDLAKTAGINRGTFYLHYEDKFDLMEQMENQLFAELGYHIDQLQSHYLSAQTFESEQKQLADTLFQFIKDRAPVLRVFLSDHGSTGFYVRFRSRFARRVRANLEQHEKFYKNLTVPMDYFLAFITSAFLGLIEQWIQNGLDKTSEEMTAIYIEIIRFIQKRSLDKI